MQKLGGILARQFWSFTVPLVVIPSLGFVAIERMPVKYTAVGTVIYDPGGYTPEVLQSILKADPTTDTVVASQGAILGSQSIARRVAVALNLADQPGFAPRGQVPVAERSQAVDSAVLRATSVTSVDASRVFAVSFTAQDPALAATAANRIMDFYLSDQLSLKTAALSAATARMRNRAAELRTKVLAQEAAIARYRAANGLIDGVQARIGTEDMSTLSEELMRAENDLAGARARQAVGDGTGTGLAQNVVAMRLAEVQAQANLDAASAHLGPNHPQVRALRQQLMALRSAAGAEMAAAQSGIVGNAQAASARLNTLRDNLLLLKAEGARQAEAEVPLQAMQQDAEATRRLLQAVLARMDQTAQQEAIETPDARILSRAEPPSAPSSPKWGLLMTASVLAALAAGSGLAWLREMAGLTFRTEAEVRANLGLPCLGAIPRMRRHRGVDVQALLAEHGTLAMRQLQYVRGRVRVVMGDPRVLAVTSTRPGEGKSTLSLALARAAARGGERVLLIDCDSLRPNLSRILGHAETPGLTELVNGPSKGEDLVHRDPASGLAFLAAGGNGDAKSVTEVARVITSAGWRRDYDLIVLDAPPILASVDALLLAEIADGILFCLRWRKTPCRLAAHARSLLGQQPGRMVAAVLTQVVPRSRAVRGFPEAEMTAGPYAAYGRR